MSKPINPSELIEKVAKTVSGNPPEIADTERISQEENVQADDCDCQGLNDLTADLYSAVG